MADNQQGKREIRTVLSQSRQLFAAAVLFSVAVNLLMLTGPVFMLQVYDRVLSSRSEATLVTLIVIVAFLFLMMGVLDHSRQRVIARIGARLQSQLDSRVLRAILSRATSPAERARPATGLHDLEIVQRFASGSGPFALLDAPWTPLFLLLLFSFHWMLGLLATVSGVLLIGIALLNQASTANVQKEAHEAAVISNYFVEQMRAGGETVQGLGMQDAVVKRSSEYRGRMLANTLAASDRGGLFSVTTRTTRLFLQSLMLGLGAWLVLLGESTPGVMIMASILLGRALAPIDQAVGQWPMLQRALAALKSLEQLLGETPPETPRTELPKPRAVLEAQNLVVAAPGARVAAVRGASFRLEPGQAAGIAGASASGKSTLARALAGVWKPFGGSVRLDGAELDQYGSSIGKYVGYLPQEVVLFEGTVAENIARLSDSPKDEHIIAAAKETSAHEMILGLPGGYDFQVSAGGAALSGGQRQRIALARAFYGSPAIVVMDEPDSNLDAVGTKALAQAVVNLKNRGGAAIIVAHRHGAFAQCDIVYVMQNGRPVPATSGAGAAPVRQLQQGGKNYRPQLPQAANKSALAQPVRSLEQPATRPPAAEPAQPSRKPRAAQVADVQEGERQRMVADSLETQVIQAIKRVVGAGARVKPLPDSESGLHSVAGRKPGP